MKEKLITLVVSLALAVGLLGVLPASRALAACAAGANYRSKQTGSWATAGTWECYNGSSWETAATPPDSTAGTIVIQSGHTVTIGANVSADQMTVSGNLTLSAAAVTLTIEDGSGTDLVVASGGVIVNSAATGGGITATGTWQIQTGGTYIHNSVTAISTPFNKLTLDAGSTFIYRGSSSLNPAMTLSNRTYQNLSFESASGIWATNIGSGANPLTVNGALTIGSNVTWTMGSFTGALNFNGDIDVNGSFAANNYTVATFKKMSLLGTGNASINSGNTITVNGTLSTGSSTVSGAGDFILASGATLEIGSVSGITSSGASGNVQNTGTRTFNTGANYTYNGTSSQMTGSGLPSTVNNLTIDNTAGVSLSGSTTVNGTLTMTNGRLTLGGNSLTIASDNAIAGGTFGASKMVVADGGGTLCKRFGTISSYTYPIGDASGPSNTAEYSPVTGVSVSGTASGTPSVCFRVTDAASSNLPNNLATYITRYWTGTVSGGSITSLSYGATFNFVTDDKVGSEGMNGKKWNGSFPWVELNAVSGNSFSGSGLTSFSDFTAFRSGILAVTLAEFYAEQVDDHVLVSWETASELGNMGFNLLRGTSPAGWDRQLNDLLIPSQSLGNPGGFVYTWEDAADLVPGTTYYYWLQDVDVNGATTLHGPVSVDFVAPTAVTLGSLSASAGPDTLRYPTYVGVGALLALLAGAAGLRRRRA